MLKSRFRSLQSKLRFHDERDSAEFIKVCACLHNFILHHNQQELNEEFFDDASIQDRNRDPPAVQQIPREEDYASSSSDSDNDSIATAIPNQPNGRVVSNSEKIVFKYRQYFQ